MQHKLWLFTQYSAAAAGEDIPAGNFPTYCPLHLC